MRTHHATLVQIILALILFVTAFFTPAIRQFIFNHTHWMIIGVCIAGIFYLQTLKITSAGERRLKSKIKHQSQIIDNLLVSNSIQAKLLKDIALPELFERHADEFTARLYASGVTITELMNYGIDPNIIAHYELYYYIGKAKEQQELLSTSKKTNGDIINTPILKVVNDANC
jgi:hypothetical protein